MLERLIRWLPATIWMVFIFVMSSQEQFPKTPGISTSALAVVAHLVLYGLLAFFFTIAIERDGRATRSTQLTAIALAVLYGLSDEFHQSFVPGRNSSALDLAVNSIGATIAVITWANRRSIIAAVVSR